MPGLCVVGVCHGATGFVDGVDQMDAWEGGSRPGDTSMREARNEGGPAREAVGVGNGLAVADATWSASSLCSSCPSWMVRRSGTTVSCPYAGGFLVVLWAVDIRGAGARSGDTGFLAFASRRQGLRGGPHEPASVKSVSPTKKSGQRTPSVRG